MNRKLHIAPMTHEHLAIAMDWAAAEGWNPGLHDAAAFLAADPDGFLMGWLGDVPVTAISVVRHSDSFGFLGFYLCHPEFRGNGYGWETWQAGMSHLGGRVVGLDGVPAQQANYERSGFVLAHHTRRYAGDVVGRRDPDIRSAARSDVPSLLALDKKINGADRAAYLTAWFDQTSTRKTLVLRSRDEISAVGSIRTCRAGHKIGPLFATSTEAAMRMMRALVDVVDARHVMIDVPDPNESGIKTVSSLGLAPIFSCARMYRGTPLKREIGLIFGETTFELG